MIGVNWFLVIFCCGIAMTSLLERIVKPVTETPAEPAPVLKAISVITDGATLAVIFDWLIEPVAVKLGYWQWQSNDIPVYNYICWFIISLVLLGLFRLLKFEKRNKFAVNLLLIQVMFFLILRTFLQN
ncbi:MAG: carotenoid biosynthesis protein [Chitinophagaceae bacterium]|nr:carotenoid biosynthesis protein [Chitinophagaceae bacterium]